MKKKYFLIVLLFLINTKISFSQNLETLIEYNLPMNGVSISKKGRVFTSMPQWIEGKKSFGVAEIIDNKLFAYPNNSWNIFDISKSKETFSNINAVHIDSEDNLWVVDYAAPYFGKTIKGSQKIIKINTQSNQIERVYYFNEKILPEGAKLNDIRVDIKKGVAYISEFGLGAILILDLKSGTSIRVLDKHYSTRAHPDVTASFQGKTFKPNKLHVNDIELSNDKKQLYYQPTGGPILYRIKTSALLNKSISKKELENAIEVFSKSTTIGGVTIDKKGRLYLGDVSNNAVIRVDKKAKHKTIVKHKNLLWPDAMAVYKNTLYIPCPKLKLLPKFNNGKQLTDSFKIYKFKI